MNTAYIREHVRLAAENVRKSKPLAGSITNFVTVNFVANAHLRQAFSFICLMKEKAWRR
ncbi:hypothetical protein [Megasphaera sp. SW808]|uniref:hypothetical protein n=1 Tax=Megasphaera sp. SW808 TaxID=2530045 RepID=UPI001F0EF593|nr:hypothetical protein [Megasphaera sp. SW808]